MHIVIEGQDATGKDTQANKINVFVLIYLFFD